MTDQVPGGTGPAAPARVLVAEDQTLVREALVTLLQRLDGIEVAGAAADGEAAVDLALRLRPDVVLMDLRMPLLDGIEATRRLRARAPGIEVIALTTYADDESVFAVLQAGASGYLTKDVGAEELARAIDAARRGEALLDPSVQRRLVEAVAGGATGPQPVLGANSPRPPDERLDGLTSREVEVLRLVTAGRSNREIAAALHLAESTVKTHVHHILRKTGLRDRSQAITYAFRNGVEPATEGGGPRATGGWTG